MFYTVKGTLFILLPTIIYSLNLVMYIKHLTNIFFAGTLKYLKCFNFIKYIKIVLKNYKVFEHAQSESGCCLKKLRSV